MSTLKQLKTKYILSVAILFFLYTVISISIYYVSINQGLEGITLNLFGGGDDGFFYWEQALKIANNEQWINTSPHQYIFGKAIKITGIESPILGRFINLFGFYLLVVTVNKLLAKLIQIKSKQIDFNINYYKALIMCNFYLSLYFSLIMYVTLSLYRDIWISVFFILTINYSVELFFSKFKIYKLVLFFISLILLYSYRDYAALSIVVGIMIGILINKNVNIKKLSIILILAFGIYYTFFMDFNVPLVNMSLRDALEYRLDGQLIYTGGSQMNISLIESNFLFFLLNYAYSVISNLFAPLPWHISGISTIIVFVFETIPMCIIIIYLIKNRKNLDSIDLYLIIQSLVMGCLIGVMNDNVGTATRLRINSWLLLMIVFIKKITIQKTFER